jgi:NCS1 family nucleobase:cation symporter-1
MLAKALAPIPAATRQLSGWAYASMWLGDGFNIGNVTLGASLVVAGTATLNLVQTLVAAGLAILLIALIFCCNDQFGYRTGAPYVIQLRLSFGVTGAKWASLLRAVPAIVWFGFQSWTGALALNQIVGFIVQQPVHQVVACFVALQLVQVVLALNGFRTIKVVTAAVSMVVLVALCVALGLILTQHGPVLATRFVHIQGSWGLPFWSLVVAFLGNYTAIFESAADYARELRPGFSTRQRFGLYAVPLTLAYGTTLVTGALLAVTTGLSSPVPALAQLFHQPVLTTFVAVFIVLGVITTNTVANIMPPAYVLTALFNLPQRVAVAGVGVLATFTCPWLLVQNTAATGLALFIKSYAIFLGPMTAIMLLEFYGVRGGQVQVAPLYAAATQPAWRWPALVALCSGAVVAWRFVDLSWLVGFGVGGLVYAGIMCWQKRWCLG